MLKPCTTCSRLVRSQDATCPFCRAAMPSGDVRVVVRGHMSRAARIAAVAAIGVACGGTLEPSKDGGTDGSTDSGVKDAAKDAVDETPIQPAYGGPFDASPPPDAGFQDVPIVPPYGQPVPPPPPPEPKGK